jgi:hypothetical protein
VALALTVKVLKIAVCVVGIGGKGKPGPESIDGPVVDTVTKSLLTIDSGLIVSQRKPFSSALKFGTLKSVMSNLVPLIV